jgi:hypothetical protein
MAPPVKYLPPRFPLASGKVRSSISFDYSAGSKVISQTQGRRVVSDTAAISASPVSVKALPFDAIKDMSLSDFYEVLDTVKMTADALTFAFNDMQKACSIFGMVCQTWQTETMPVHHTLRHHLQDIEVLDPTHRAHMAQVLDLAKQCDRLVIAPPLSYVTAAT